MYADVYVFGRHEDESPPAVCNIYTCTYIYGYLHTYMDMFTHIDILIRISVYTCVYLEFTSETLGTPTVSK